MISLCTLIARLLTLSSIHPLLLHAALYECFCLKDIKNRIVNDDDDAYIRSNVYCHILPFMSLSSAVAREGFSFTIVAKGDYTRIITAKLYARMSAKRNLGLIVICRDYNFYSFSAISLRFDILRCIKSSFSFKMQQCAKLTSLFCHQTVFMKFKISSSVCEQMALMTVGGQFKC
jgi:hypothetical protein